MLNYFLLIDSAENAVSMEPVLQRMNVNSRLLVAKNGKEGVRMFRRVYPPVVLVNFQLPDMTGIECIGQLKAIKKNPNAIIYLFNNIVTPHLATRAMNAGAKGCFILNDQQPSHPLNEIFKGYLSQYRPAS